jgi:hypothetical protein
MILFPKCGCCGDPDCKCPDPCAFGIRLTSPPEYATGEDYYGEQICEYRNTCYFGVGVDDINDITDTMATARGPSRSYTFYSTGGEFCNLGYPFSWTTIDLEHGGSSDVMGSDWNDFPSALTARFSRTVRTGNSPFLTYFNVYMTQTIEVAVFCSFTPFLYDGIFWHNVGTALKGYTIRARLYTRIFTKQGYLPEEEAGRYDDYVTVIKDTEIFWNTGCTGVVRRSETCKAKPKQYDGYEDDLNTPGNTGDDKRPEHAPAFPWPMSISVFDDRVEVNGNSFSWLKTTTEYYPNAEESTSAQAVYDNACVRDFDATFQVRKQDCYRPGPSVARCCVLDEGYVADYVECQCNGTVVAKPTQTPPDLDDATMTLTVCGLTATAPINQWASGNEPEFSDGAGGGNGENISVSCTPPNGEAFTATRFNFDVSNFSIYTACNSNVVAFHVQFSLVNDTLSRIATCYLEVVFNDITGESVVSRLGSFPGGFCCFETMAENITASINIAP